jgi:hypothetical protein
MGIASSRCLSAVKSIIWSACGTGCIFVDQSAQLALEYEQLLLQPLRGRELRVGVQII